MKLHGLDWLAMALSLVALILLGKRNRYGFVSFMVANVSWIAAGILLSNLAICLGNLAFLGYNLRGFIVWSRERKATPAKAGKTRGNDAWHHSRRSGRASLSVCHAVGRMD